MSNRTLVALSLATTLFRAEAAGGLILIDAPPEQSYTLAVGPAVVGQPEAPGSGRTKITPIPGIDFYSPLGAFASTDDGVGWNFSRRRDLQLGIRLWPVFGRDDDRSRRRGLHDIGTRLSKGGFLNYAPWEFLVLQTSVLAGSGDRNDGVQAEAGATVGSRVGPAALLGLTLGTTWANGPHLRSYYGVTAEESAAGGLPVYTPAAGWQDVNLALNGELRIDSRWKLSGQVLAARLVGATKRSPVATSREQTALSLTLWYELR